MDEKCSIIREKSFRPTKDAKKVVRLLKSMSSYLREENTKQTNSGTLKHLQVLEIKRRQYRDVMKTFPGKKLLTKVNSLDIPVRTP